MAEKGGGGINIERMGLKPQGALKAEKNASSEQKPEVISVASVDPVQDRVERRELASPATVSNEKGRTETGGSKPEMSLVAPGPIPQGTADGELEPVSKLYGGQPVKIEEAPGVKGGSDEDNPDERWMEEGWGDDSLPSIEPVEPTAQGQIEAGGTEEAGQSRSGAVFQTEQIFVQAIGGLPNNTLSLEQQRGLNHEVEAQILPRLQGLTPGEDSLETTFELVPNFTTALSLERALKDVPEIGQVKIVDFDENKLIFSVIPATPEQAQARRAERVDREKAQDQWAQAQSRQAPPADDESGAAQDDSGTVNADTAAQRPQALEPERDLEREARIEATITSLGEQLEDFNGTGQRLFEAGGFLDTVAELGDERGLNRQDFFQIADQLRGNTSAESLRGRGRLAEELLSRVESVARRGDAQLAQRLDMVVRSLQLEEMYPEMKEMFDAVEGISKGRDVDPKLSHDSYYYRVSWEVGSRLDRERGVEATGERRAKYWRRVEPGHHDYEEWEEAFRDEDYAKAEEIVARFQTRQKLNDLLRPEGQEEQALEIAVSGLEGDPEAKANIPINTERDKVAQVVEAADSIGRTYPLNRYIGIIRAMDPSIDLSEPQDNRALLAGKVADVLNGTLYSPRQVRLVVSCLGLDEQAQSEVMDQIYQSWEKDTESLKGAPRDGYPDRFLLSDLRSGDEGYKKWLAEQEVKRSPPAEIKPEPQEQTPAQKRVTQLLDLLKEGEQGPYSVEDLTAAFLKVPDLPESARTQLSKGNPQDVLTYLTLLMKAGRFDTGNGEFWASLDPRVSEMLIGPRSRLRASEPAMAEKGERALKAYAVERAGDLSEQAEEDPRARFERLTVGKNDEEREHDKALMDVNIELSDGSHPLAELRSDFENWAYSIKSSDSAGQIQKDLESLPLTQTLIKAGDSGLVEFIVDSIHTLRYRPAQIGFLLDQTRLTAEIKIQIVDLLSLGVKNLESRPTYASYCKLFKESELYKGWEARQGAVSATEAGQAEPQPPAQRADEKGSVDTELSEDEKLRKEGFMNQINEGVVSINTDDFSRGQARSLIETTTGLLALGGVSEDERQDLQKKVTEALKSAPDSSPRLMLNSVLLERIRTTNDIVQDDPVRRKNLIRNELKAAELLGLDKNIAGLEETIKELKEALDIKD